MFYLPLQKISRLFHQRNTVKHGHLQRFSPLVHRHLSILLHLKRHEFIISSNLDGSTRKVPWFFSLGGKAKWTTRFHKFWKILDVFMCCSLFLQVFLTKHTPKKAEAITSDKGKLGSKYLTVDGQDPKNNL